MLPALLAQGLMDYKFHYQEIEDVYYDLDTTILFLSFMYLCRIHNPEQLRHISPGEFGKLLGLDRIPEARCLRTRLKQIIQQNKSEQWGMTQANKWDDQPKYNSGFGVSTFTNADGGITYGFADGELTDAIERLATDTALAGRLAAISARLKAEPGTEKAARLIEGAARG